MELHNQSFHLLGEEDMAAPLREGGFVPLCPLSSVLYVHAGENSGLRVLSVPTVKRCVIVPAACVYVSPL